MPILTSFALPASVVQLTLPQDAKPFYLCFISSIHPETKVSWCPDVRAALPVIEKAFAAGEEGSDLAFVEVGQRPEWKEASNKFRTNWNVHNVPTLVRYERVQGGEVKEVARLVEEEILDEGKLGRLIA